LAVGGFQFLAVIAQSTENYQLFCFIMKVIDLVQHFQYLIDQFRTVVQQIAG